MLCLIILIFLGWFLGFHKDGKTVATSTKQEVKVEKKQVSRKSNKVLPPNCIWRSELLGTYRKQKKNAI
jgi:hypothetical protein